MRTVRWAEFQTLPAGTIFQEYFPDFLEQPRVLEYFERNEHGIIDDFFTVRLLPNRSGEHRSLLVEWGHGSTRDGCHDHENGQWVVWEEEDLKRLAGWLLDPARMVREINSEMPASCSIEPMKARLG